MISLIILLVCLLMLLTFSFFKMSLVKKKTCDAFDSVMNGNADELNKHLHVYI